MLLHGWEIFETWDLIWQEVKLAHAKMSSADNNHLSLREGFWEIPLLWAALSFCSASFSCKVSVCSLKTYMYTLTPQKCAQCSHLFPRLCCHFIAALQLYVRALRENLRKNNVTGCWPVPVNVKHFKSYSETAQRAGCAPQLCLIRHIFFCLYSFTHTFFSCSLSVPSPHLIHHT